MALRDGVLVQSERFWAAAVRRSDGIQVCSGDRARMPGHEIAGRIPVVRGLVKLGESLAVLPAVRRAAGGPVLPQEEPRILAAMLASALGTHLVRHRLTAAPFAREVAAMGFSLAPVLLLLRDSRLSRYHGAEHMSIAAYERQIDARDADKEHARCGSNMIVPLAATTIATNMFLRATGKEAKPLAALVAGLVSIGAAVELFGWMGHHQSQPLARTLGWPGREIQRRFTTSEPTEEQLDVAGEAIGELVRRERGCGSRSVAPRLGRRSFGSRAGSGFRSLTFL